MRSTLKKSLYLGLAALSFASVAGAANNANAASHHRRAKAVKHYATASYKAVPDQGQSNTAYNVTGSNAIFNKPGTVRGAKQTVSKSTMNDLASAKENFMVYQTAVTSRNSKYIKVVSFDKQYRGWIYAGKNDNSSYGTGVQKINLATSATPQNGQVYLKTPGQTALKTTPEGAQFNASADNFSHTGFVAKDAFNVDSAQTVNKTGTTWFHVTDQKDNTINGWVPQNQVQLSSQNNYFDKNNDIKVNYTNNGQVVKSAIVKVSDLNKRYSNSSVVSPETVNGNKGLADRINDTAGNALNNTGYSFNDFTNTSSDSIANSNGQDNNVNAIQFVEPGDTVNLDINNAGNGNGNVASHMDFNVLGSNFTAPSQLNKGSFAVPSLKTDQLAKQMNGYNTREHIDMNKVLGITNKTNNNHIDDKDGNNIFGVSTNTTNPNKLGVLYGGTQYAQSNIDDGAASDSDVQAAQSVASDPSNNNAVNLTQNTQIQQGHPFHYVYMLNIPVTRDNNSGNYGQNIKLYYNKVAVNGAAATATQSNTTQNYLGLNS